MKQRLYLPFLFLILQWYPRHSNGQDAVLSTGEFFEGEPFLTQNPADPQHVVVTWMGLEGLELVRMQVRVSHDGGSTWGPITAIPHITAGYTMADPSMAWDSEGNLYLCYIDYHPAGTSGKVLVRRSADGGDTWEAPVEVIDAWDDGFEVPVDRPWLAIDRSGGALDGYQYVTTKPAPWIPFPNRNYLITSPDGLAFDDWRHIDTIGWQIGDFIQAPMAAPAVGSDGRLHVVYPAWEWTENILPRFVHASSSDGGQSFTYHEMLESPGTELNSDTSAKVGYQLLSDPSDPQHLAFLFVYKTLGDNDIYLLESTNGGSSWAAPLRVNADPAGTGVMQDLVWGDFDEEGNLAVCWRDRRNAVDTGYAVSSEIWGAIWWKDSAAFSADFPMSGIAADFDEVLYGNGNDFMSLQFAQDTLYAVWGDARSGTLEIWFSKRSATDPGTAIAIPLTDNAQTSIRITPNPALDLLQVTTAQDMELQVVDSRGQTIMTLISLQGQTLTVDISHLTPGRYFIRKANSILGRSAGFVKI